MKRSISPAGVVIVIVVVLAVIALVGWRYVVSKGEGGSEEPPRPEAEMRDTMLEGGEAASPPGGSDEASPTDEPGGD